MAGEKDKAQRKHNETEKLEIGKRICDLYAEGNTIESCCDTCGISDRAFRNWMESISELAELYKKARQKQSIEYKERLRRKADTALEKLVEGYEYEETEVTGVTITDDNGKKVFVPKGVKKVTKKMQPNITAVIFARTNTNDPNDPDFVNSRNVQQITGKVEIPAMEKLPDELIENFINLISNKNERD